MRDPKERLLDILDAIAAIERHRGRDKAAFELDELLQVWFLRHLQIIGEAARALTGDVRALALEIPCNARPGARREARYHSVGHKVAWRRRGGSCHPVWEREFG